MITMTIKGIPKETHRALKKRAAVNRRSLNSEIIFTLETMLGGARREVVQIPRFQNSIRKAARRK
jgi:plasmid stability protein